MSFVVGELPLKNQRWITKQERLKTQKHEIKITYIEGGDDAGGIAGLEFNGGAEVS